MTSKYHGNSLKLCYNNFLLIFKFCFKIPESISRVAKRSESLVNKKENTIQIFKPYVTSTLYLFYISFKRLFLMMVKCGSSNNWRSIVGVRDDGSGVLCHNVNWNFLQQKYAPSEVDGLTSQILIKKLWIISSFN